MPKHLHYYLPVTAGLILLFIGIVLGEYYQLYDHIAHFDTLLHATGGLIVAWFFDYLFFEEIKHMAPWKIILILVSGAALVGTLWEIAEYISNFSRHISPLWYHYFHGGNLGDTIADLVADMTGALLLALPLTLKKKSQG
jgi:uncharacterized membrane protein